LFTSLLSSIRQSQTTRSAFLEFAEGLGLGIAGREKIKVREVGLV